MKTKEELTALKNEVKALNKKLSELNEDELAQVTGGFIGYRLNPFVKGTNEMAAGTQEQEKIIGYGWLDQDTP